MHIDDLSMALLAAPDNTVTVPTNWAQGRTVYGGLTAALIFQALHQVVAENQASSPRPIRYINYSFIGPLLTKEPMSIEVDLLRSGRSATQLMAKVIQNKKVCVIAQACFGINRLSKIKVENKLTHQMPVPKKGNFLPQIPKVVPKFLRHFEFNLQEGRWPFMRGKKDHLYGWMRFKKKPSVFSDLHLIATIDAWPCPVLQQLKMPAPASTMNWNLEFPQQAALPNPDDWIAYQSHTEHGSDGYVFSNAAVWNQEGGLLALSRQTIGIFG